MKKSFPLPKIMPEEVCLCGDCDYPDEILAYSGTILWSCFFCGEDGLFHQYSGFMSEIVWCPCCGMVQALSVGG